MLGSLPTFQWKGTSRRAGLGELSFEAAPFAPKPTPWPLAGAGAESSHPCFIGISGNARPAASHLIFTSPPYTSFRDWDEMGFAAYWNDFESIFSGLRAVPHPAGRLVVELSNVREANGRIRPVAFTAALRLREMYEFLGEVVPCNIGDEPAGPGYNHAYLLLFGSGHCVPLRVLVADRAGRIHPPRRGSKGPSGPGHRSVAI